MALFQNVKMRDWVVVVIGAAIGIWIYWYTDNPTVPAQQSQVATVTESTPVKAARTAHHSTRVSSNSDGQSDTKTAPLYHYERYGFGSAMDIVLNAVVYVCTWATYSAGPVFWFWAWPFIIMPALFMRKHLHAAITFFAWLGVKIDLPGMSLPAQLQGSPTTFALGAFSLLCIWTAFSFMALCINPVAYRQRSWWRQNSGWLVLFVAVAFANWQRGKEKETERHGWQDM